VECANEDGPSVASQDAVGPRFAFDMPADAEQGSEEPGALTLPQALMPLGT